jgi:hypothetical protein
VTYSITSEDWENIKEQVNNKKVNFISGRYEKGRGFICNISMCNGDDILFGSYTTYTIKKLFKFKHVDHYSVFARKITNKRSNHPLITFGKNDFIRLKTIEHVVSNDLVNGLINYNEIDKVFTSDIFENSIKTERVFIKFKDGTILPVYNTKEKINSKIKDALKIKHEIFGEEFCREDEENLENISGL